MIKLEIDPNVIYALCILAALFFYVRFFMKKAEYEYYTAIHEAEKEENESGTDGETWEDEEEEKPLFKLRSAVRAWDGTDNPPISIIWEIHNDAGSPVTHISTVLPTYTGDPENGFLTSVRFSAASHRPATASDCEFSNEYVVALLSRLLMSEEFMEHFTLEDLRPYIKSNSDRAEAEQTA